MLVKLGQGSTTKGEKNDGKFDQHKIGSSGLNCSWIGSKKINARGLTSSIPPSARDCLVAAIAVRGERERTLWLSSV